MTKTKTSTTQHNSVGNWIKEEDEIILKYVYEREINGENMMWGKLEQILVSRSGKSCRERWFNHVDPRIKKGDWTAEEEWVLFILRDQ